MMWVRLVVCTMGSPSLRACDAGLLGQQVSWLTFDEGRTLVVGDENSAQG